MYRSLPYLGRGLLGMALVASLGFGAATAFASPGTGAKRPPICPDGTVGCWCYGYEDCVLPGTCPCG